MNLCLSDKKKCDFSRNCPIHSVWANVQSKVVEVLKKSSFEELSRQKN
jgi:DNA-binding IscR family transcriptional regulator